MQLNNKSNHSIIRIQERNNDFFAQSFVNDLSIDFSENNTNFIPDKTLKTGTKTIADFELQKAYEYLASLPGYSDFEISTGKNWKFADEIIRLIVDKNKLTPHLLAADAVGQLVSYVLADPTIKQKTIDTLDGFIYIYLKFINPDHLPIIQGADCIVIDNL